MAANLVEFTDSNFEAEALKADKPVLVDFWAPWCGPCRMVGPIIEELAGSYSGKVKVGKLNTDDNPNVANELQSTIRRILTQLESLQGVKEWAAAVGIERYVFHRQECAG